MVGWKLGGSAAFAACLIASGCEGAISARDRDVASDERDVTARDDGGAGQGGGAAGSAGDAPPPGGPNAGDASIDAGDDPPTQGELFEALPPSVYVPKVKSLLTGQVATAEEIARVESDPEALKQLVETWQDTPAYEARILDFFTAAFQQGDVTAAFINNATSFQQGLLDERVIQNMRESFGRTALQLVKEGVSFTEVLTTRRFMLTPALMVAMAWLDERQGGDNGGIDDALNRKLGDDAHYVMIGDESIPLEQSVDPASPNYLRFSSPQVAAQSGDCAADLTVTLDDRLTLYTATTGETMMMWFMGQRMQRGFCVYDAGRGVLDPSDFTTWRMVAIRKPAPGEERTWLYEIPKFRSADELVFVRPYVGFYTTPAFLYTWQTNTSNQGRVTINQTLISAVGRAFDGSLSAKPVDEIAVAAEHAAPGSVCYGCHVTMDPMRQFFRSTYTYYYGPQGDSAQRELPFVYAFDGESELATDIASLGARLAQSRWFAIGWTHKLCTWADAAVCHPEADNRLEPTDPEFLRIVQAFVDSGYSFRTLVTELFSSPLVTYSAATETVEQRGASFPVAKRAHLCETWNQRLGLIDACGLGALPSTSTGDPVKTIATVLPADSYSRGQTRPTLANDPGMFFYAGVENACAALSRRVVDGESPASTRFQSSAAEAAIGAMVHDFMGVIAPRDAEPLAILSEHFADARAEGKSATEALRSTFMLACMAPSSVGVGQ